MMADMSGLIKSISEDKDISEELLLGVIEKSLLAAYKRKFGTIENAFIEFSEEDKTFSVYQEKEVVEDVYEDFKEIDLEEALTINPDSAIGDILRFEVDIENDFNSKEIGCARQVVMTELRAIKRNSIYSEYKQKEGNMIIGYYQREKDGNIFIDLGNGLEGILPKKYQSPREKYRRGDRIRTYIYEVVEKGNSVSIVLSRSHTEFVEKLFENEVPEISDGLIDVMKIVREPGFRTKMAVYAKSDNIDPVGACVGVKGGRIQAVIKELEGEKIDIIRYDVDPKNYIANALSPAEIQFVFIADSVKKQAYAVVKDQQLSFAIGKQGQNVRLANRLVDWNIDVKTVEQFEEMGLVDSDALFKDEVEELVYLSDLDAIPAYLINKFSNFNIKEINEFLDLDEEALSKMDGVTAEEIALINKILNENIEFEEYEPSIEEEDSEDEEISTDEEVSEDEEFEEEIVYECPECGGEITTDMVTCPSCGIGISFEEDDDEEVE